MRDPLTRRRLLASLAIGAGALALAACGTTAPAAGPAPATSPPAAPKAAGATPAAQAAQATAAQPAAAAGKGVTLAVIHRIAYGPEIDKQVFPVGYDMFKQKYGVTINETLLPEDQQMPVKILTMVAGGTPPDAAYIHPQWLASMAAKGALIAIDSYMKQAEVKAEDLSPGALQYFQFPHGAKTFGIPFYSGPCVTIFNRTLFKQAGVQAPDEVEKAGGWTWEAARDAAVKLTKGSGPDKQFGWDSLTNGLHWLNIIIWGFGGQLWTDDLTKCLLGEQPALDALQFYADFEARYHVVPSAAEAQGVTAGKSGRLISGRVAMQYGIKGNVPEIAQFAEQKNVEVGMCPIPAGAKGRFVRNGPNSFCVMKGTKYQEEAFNLINWMSLDDFQALQYKVGASIPPRKSQFDTPAFKQSLKPWESLDVWKQAADQDKALVMAATHLDIQNTFSPAWDPIHLGQKSAKESITPIVPKIDDLLAKGKA